MFVAPWSVRFFGGLRAEREDGAASFTRLRTQTVTALFAYLCAYPGREHGREELAALFWPDADLEAGRNQLRVALNALRRALEPPPTPSGAVLEASRTHVRLRPEAIKSSDVAAFEAAIRAKDWRRAGDIYTAGSFLPGIYDEWVLTERERLEALADEAREYVEEERPGPAAPQAPSPPAAVLAATPHRLPLTLDRFFGREDEIGRLEKLLHDPSIRLVTLTGPGGVGKTRLAVEAAHRLIGAAVAFSGGVWFVPVAGVPNAERLPSALPALLRDALHIDPQPGVAPLDQVAEQIGDQRTLFLLDNLEQAADGAAEALPPLLARLPGAIFLVTSRVRLGLRGEAALPLSPLPVPEVGIDALEQIADSAAVALFADRARSAEADFALTSRNSADVASLARYLDGIPLALELAAAWANVLTPRQMRDQIAAGSPTLLAERRMGRREERHRSLRAAVAWSLGLLPSDLAALFARLSVFRGGFRAEAAVEVCEVSGIHAALSRLNQHSLVTTCPTEDGTAVRFDLLEVLREAGAERLSKGEQEALARRHAEWVVSSVTSAAPEARSTVVADTVGPDNVRSALRYLLSERSGAVDALRLCVATWQFWFGRGLWHEARETLEATLAREKEAGIPAALRAETWKALGGLFLYSTDFPQARRCFERQIEIAEEAGDAIGAAAARLNLAGVVWGAGDPETARVLYQGALDVLRPAGATPPHLLGNCLNNYATLLHIQGEYDAADPLFAEGLEIFRSLGEAGRMGAGACLNGLGASAEEREEFAGARERFTEAVEIYRQIGDSMRLADALLHLAGIHVRNAKSDPMSASPFFAESLAIRVRVPNPDGFLRTYEELALFAARRGRHLEAARLWGAVETLRATHGIHTSAGQERDRCTAETILRTALGDTTYIAAYTVGRGWNSEQALAAAEAEITTKQ